MTSNAQQQLTPDSFLLTLWTLQNKLFLLCHHHLIPIFSRLRYQLSTVVPFVLLLISQGSSSSSGSQSYPYPSSLPLRIPPNLPAILGVANHSCVVIRGYLERVRGPHAVCGISLRLCEDVGSAPVKIGSDMECTNATSWTVTAPRSQFVTPLNFRIGFCLQRSSRRSGPMMWPRCMPRSKMI